MTDLAAFIKARLAEDEAAARDLIESEAAAAEWSEPTSGVLVTGPGTAGDAWDGTHPIGDSRITRFIADHDPARVLREVAAKRQIVTRYQFAARQVEVNRVNGNAAEMEAWDKIAAALELCVLSIASVWSGHPDYDPAWALT